MSASFSDFKVVPKKIGQVTLSKIIDKKAELDKKADEFYKAIQTHYYVDESGHTANYPMDVSAGHCGKSNDPDHRNAYALVRHYYDFIKKDLESEHIGQLLKFFSMKVYGSKALMALLPILPEHEVTKLNEGGIVLFPDRFIAGFQEFAKGLNELKAMMDAYKLDEQAVVNDLTELFQRQAESLINDGYDLELVMTAYEKAPIAAENKSQGSFDVSLNDLFLISQNFDRTSWRSWAVKICIDPTTGNVTSSEMKYSPREKEEKLLNFLKVLPHPVLIEAFKNAFTKADQQKNLAQTMQEVGARWRPESLWSVPEEHRKRFAGALDDIKKTTFDDFKKNKRK